MGYRLLELCTCTESRICLFCMQLVVCAAATLLGLWLVWQPKRTIEMQIAFYRLINWKIEPISMEREVRNTRIMGAAVIAAALISLVYIVR